MKEELNNIQNNNQNEKTIMELHNKINELTQARENISGLLREVSERANKLVQQIIVLKSKKGQKVDFSSIEKSANEISLRLEKSSLQFSTSDTNENLETSQDQITRLTKELLDAREEIKNLKETNLISKDLATIKQVPNENASNQIEELKRQVRVLTKARDSIAELLSEVSRRASLLIKQISKLKSQKGNSNEN